MGEVAVGMLGQTQLQFPRVPADRQEVSLGYAPEALTGDREDRRHRERVRGEAEIQLGLRTVRSLERRSRIFATSGAMVRRTRFLRSPTQVDT